MGPPVYRKSRVKDEPRGSDMSKARVSKKNKNDAYKVFGERYLPQVDRIYDNAEKQLLKSKEHIHKNVRHKIEEISKMGWQDSKLSEYLYRPFEPTQVASVPVTPAIPVPSTSSSAKETIVKKEAVTPALHNPSDMETVRRPPQIPQREMNFFTPAGPMRLPNFITPKVDDLVATRFRQQRVDEVGFSVNGSPLMTVPPIQIAEDTAMISEVLNANEAELTPCSRQIQATLKQLIRKKASMMMNESMSHH